MKQKQKQNKNTEDNTIFIKNTTAGRLVTSKTFNFLYDNSSGIAFTYGNAPEDTPEFDPIGPQEILFDTSDFSLPTYTDMLNKFACAMQANPDKSLSSITPKTKAADIVALSTISNCIFKIHDTSLLTKKEFKAFMKYLKVFYLIPNFILAPEDVTAANIDIIKSYDGGIIVQSTDKNESALLKAADLLKDSGVLHSVKLIVNRASLKAVDAILNLIRNDIAIGLMFRPRYPNANEIRNLMSICNERGLTNVFVVTDHHDDKIAPLYGDITIPMLKSSAATFSVFVKDGKVAPCEFCKSNMVALDECKSISDFWFNKFFSSVRKKVIKTNFVSI